MTYEEIDSLKTGDYVIWIEDTIPKPVKFFSINKSGTRNFGPGYANIKETQLTGTSAKLCDSTGKLITKRFFKLKLFKLWD